MITETQLKRMKIQREKEETNSPSARSKAISDYNFNKEKLKWMLKIKELQNSSLYDFLKNLCSGQKIYEYIDLKEKQSKLR